MLVQRAWWRARRGGATVRDEARKRAPRSRALGPRPRERNGVHPLIFSLFPSTRAPKEPPQPWCVPHAREHRAHAQPLPYTPRACPGEEDAAAVRLSRSRPREREPARLFHPHHHPSSLFSSQADIPADARPPPNLGGEEQEEETNEQQQPGGHPPHNRPAALRVVAPAAAGGGLGRPLVDLAAAPRNQPGGPLVDGAAATVDAAPSAADAALKGHDDEVKALHGGGSGTHDPKLSKKQKKGIGPGISGANKVMDARRAHYGVPQGRRTGGH